MKRKERVTVKWSTKENDWQSRYPEWQNRNARIVGNSFFNMIRKFEEFMGKDWQGKPTKFKSLRQYLSDAGFDPNTFSISVYAKSSNPPTQNKEL